MRATTRQKYAVPAASPLGVYDAVVTLVATCGGGFAVPKLTSYDVAPAALHVRPEFTATPVALLAGVGDPSVAGGCVADAVVNDQIGPVEVPAAFRATIFQK